jgi:LemA protein
LIASIAILVILVLVVVVLAGMYNSLVKRRNQVDNSWSQIEVQLKRRHDLIPNLVEAVKDYLSYEQETLTNVTNARAAAIVAGRRPRRRRRTR